MILKPCQPPRLSFVAIDRFGLVAAPPGVSDVIDAAAERASIPSIDNIEGQWRMNRDGRMKPGRWLPSLKAHAGNALT